ncbi:MAG: hypothetical protein JNK85_20720 [Verrucomicrobiales bacterium]|nr:hypothetical protein [Verrucomicrobiales bacterium]
MIAIHPLMLAVLATAAALHPQLASAAASAPSATTVQFVDPELERSVRQALQKPSGLISVTEMESLTVLDASRVTRLASVATPIRSLVGLEFARSLKELHLSAELPWGLTSLESLEVWRDSTLGNPPSYLGLPASTDHSRLWLNGYSGSMTILGAWLHLVPEGRITGRPLNAYIHGAPRKRVSVQRSVILLNWETLWETTTGTGLFVTYEAPIRFFRVVETP